MFARDFDSPMRISMYRHNCASRVPPSSYETITMLVLTNLPYHSISVPNPISVALS